MGYKDDAIASAEQAINAKRKRRQQLQSEIAELEVEESEARAVLQLLKNGSAPKMRGGKRIVDRKEFVEALEAAGHGDTVFTPGDVAELLGLNSTSTAGRLKRMAGQGDLIEMVEAGGPGIPSKFKLKPQPSKRVQRAMQSNG